MNIERQNILNQIFQECVSKGLSIATHGPTCLITVMNSDSSLYLNAYYDGDLHNYIGGNNITTTDLLTKIKEYK